MSDLTRIDFRKLNSATKYPSIPTYHALGEKGRLAPEVLVPFDLVGEKIITEKIDGANARIVVAPDGDYVIGSREEFLTARGDRIPNPAQSIVEAVYATAQRISIPCSDRDPWFVIFGEVYGGRTSSNAKQYTASQTLGFRMFDAIAIEDAELQQVLGLPLDEIARWRDGGGQPFVDEQALNNYARALDVSLTPRLSGECPPIDLAETLAWLQARFPQGKTYAGIDVAGRPEGVVIRTPTRDRIAKIKFEDYQRTLRK